MKSLFLATVLAAVSTPDSHESNFNGKNQIGGIETTTEDGDRVAQMQEACMKKLNECTEEVNLTCTKPAENKRVEEFNQCQKITKADEKAQCETISIANFLNDTSICTQKILECLPEGRECTPEKDRNEYRS